MKKFIALDLFCGGGGACLGMQQAGFEVVGIDIKQHLNYPGEFIQADVLNLPVDIMDFDLIWASPPCQKFSMALNHANHCRKNHPNLIPEIRLLIDGHPYTVIENVPQAPLRPDLTLWGPQLGLGPTDDYDGLWRKRTFELSFWCWSLPRPKMEKGRYVSITKSMGSNSHFYRRAQGKRGTLHPIEYKHAMGIPICSKMSRKEVGEAVPPPYAKYIADEVFKHLNSTT